jgi:hypothetical protein
VLYVIQDPNDPAPITLQSTTNAEVAYNEKYQREHNGLPWRHFFDASGPRKPPILFMWPAKQIGEIHAVTSPQGYW